MRDNLRFEDQTCLFPFLSVRKEPGKALFNFQMVAIQWESLTFSEVGILESHPTIQTLQIVIIPLADKC